MASRRCQLPLKVFTEGWVLTQGIKGGPWVCIVWYRTPGGVFQSTALRVLPPTYYAAQHWPCNFRRQVTIGNCKRDLGTLCPNVDK